MYTIIFKKLTIRLLFIALFFTPLLACSTEVKNNADKREPSNIEDIRSILFSEAYKDAFIGNYDLRYFGSASTETTNFHLYVFLKEFGNKRLTKRLIIISHNFHYLGMFEIPELPNKIDGNMVMFPLEEKWGNKITFEGDRVPQKIYLDGEPYTLFRGNEK